MSSTSPDSAVLVDLFGAGKYAELESLAQLQLKPNPVSGFLWKMLAVAQHVQGKDALVAMQMAAALLPNDAEAHRNYGVVLKDHAQPDAAVASYRRALAIKPDYAEAHCNLGEVLQAMGQFDEAAASCRRALELEPDYVEAYLNLGNALQDLEQFEDAVVCYRRAIELKPGYAEAYGNLGTALYELGQVEDAMANYCRALELKPACADVYGNLAKALMHLGQLDEAAEIYRLALGFKPDEPQIHSDLGKVLRDLGQFAEAQACHQQALTIKPDFIPAFVALGKDCLDEGQFAEAAQYFRQALEIKPETPGAWAGLARCRKMSDADIGWLETAEKIAGGRIGWCAEAELRHAMGKYCDDTGRFASAFRFYQMGNELNARFAAPYDSEERERQVSHLIATYLRESMQRSWAGASDSDRPLFIVGMPRSGTSLTEQILSSHPAIHGAGELPFWLQQIPHQLDAPPPDVDADTIAGIAAACLAKLDKHSTAALRVVDKMPGNFNCLGLIHATFPNARILHTQRNPIDTCLSVYFQNFGKRHSYGHRLASLAHYYREYHRLMAHWRAVLPADVFLDVPYEALVDDPEMWSRRIIKFVGLEWDDRCLDSHKTERRIGTASNWQAKQPIYKSSKDRWRNYEEHVGQLLPLQELDLR